VNSTPPLKRHSGLRIVPIRGKGRGVVCNRLLKKGTLLEVAPIIKMTKDDKIPDACILSNYPFEWDEAPYERAFVIGIIALLNHSSDPNCWTECDIENDVFRVRALKDIPAGTELVHDYGVDPWFKYKK
jgi:SET domain-containing protein